MTEAELRALWGQIAGAVGEKDEEGKFTLRTLATTMKEGAHALFQHVFNVGHSERNKTAQAAEKELRDSISAKEADIARLTGELDEAKKGQPDAARRVTELEGKIKELQTAHASETKALKESVSQAKKAAKLESLRAKLAGSLDADYAEVLTMKPEIAERIRLNEDGTFDVLQSVGGIPFAPAEGKDAMDLLVAEVVERTRKEKPSLVTSNAESGSGTGTGRAAEGGGKAGDASYYEGLRKTVADKQKPSESDAGSAQQRMGMVRVGAQ